MTQDRSQFGRVQEFCGALRDGDATVEIVAELEALLAEDLNARQYYVDFMFMHALMERYAKIAENDEEQSTFADGNSAWKTKIDEMPISPPTHGFLSSTLHGTIGFFSQELPFSLLIATVLTSLGLWFASLVHISVPEQIAKDSSQRAQPASDRTLERVGKITGMLNCKWADPQTETSLGSNVLLGRRYSLASGLMEITYNTGAKVILQGPVTYEVESRDGGFLAIGKLTARLDNAKPQAANQKSSLSPLPSPLFTIKTPTAVVTDLGTEFGVEVTKEGTTTSHVFRGSVQVQATSADGSIEGVAQVLRENQSACIRKNDSTHKNRNRVVVFTSPAIAKGFIREIPRKTPKPIIKTFDLVDVVAGGNGFFGQAKRRHRSDDGPGNQYAAIGCPAVCERRQVSSCRRVAFDRRRVYSQRPSRPSPNGFCRTYICWISRDGQ